MPEKKQYLCLLRPTRLAMLTAGPLTEELPIIQAHGEYLQQLIADDVAIFFGRTETADEKSFGRYLFLAASDTQAREIIAADPGVSGGIMTPEMYPYHVAQSGNWQQLKTDS